MTLSFHYQPSLKSISNPSIIPLQCRPSNILGSAIKMYCKVLSIAIVTMTRYSPCFELGRVCPDQTHVAPVMMVDKTAAEESSEFEAVWSCLKLFEGSADVSNTLCKLSINLTNTNTYNYCSAAGPICACSSCSGILKQNPISALLRIASAC